MANQWDEQFGRNTAHSVTSRGIHSGEPGHHLTSLTVSDTGKKRTQKTTQVVGHMTEHYIHIPWIPLFYRILFSLQNLYFLDFHYAAKGLLYEAINCQLVNFMLPHLNDLGVHLIRP